MSTSIREGTTASRMPNTTHATYSQLGDFVEFKGRPTALYL
ncbi:MAG TPA: hypothetical protein VFM24_06775 [Nitrospira sp.]|nr:hypothetical protein [Nitrospira sp.]